MVLPRAFELLERDRCGMTISDLLWDARQYPACLLSIGNQDSLFGIYTAVLLHCFLACKSGEHALSALLQIIDTPYWILKRLRYGDPVKPRSCILSFHTWFSHFPCFRGNSTLLVVDIFTIS